MSDRKAVMDAMQAGYGDATQGVLDAKVASDVLDALRHRGWVSLEELAAVIIAAGGEVVLTPKALDEASGAQVFIADHFESGGKILRARRDMP